MNFSLPNYKVGNNNTSVELLVRTGLDIKCKAVALCSLQASALTCCPQCQGGSLAGFRAKLTQWGQIGRAHV